MNDVWDAITSNAILIQAVAFALATSYGVALYTFFQRVRSRRRERRGEFFESLTGGLQRGIVRDLEDVRNIYQGTIGESLAESSRALGLSRLLKEFLARLNQGKIGDSEDDRAISDWHGIVTGVTRELDEASPYEGLPEAERNAISDIDEFLQQDNKDAVRRKLQELGAMIEARSADLEGLKSTNRWAVPLAIVSSLLTIGFGIISILN